MSDEILEAREEEKQVLSRPQLSFTWKPGNQEDFAAGYAEWVKDQPKGRQSQQDYILWLIKRSKIAGEAADLREKFDNLGVKELMDAHYARRKAEDNLLAVIADTVRESKERAEAEVLAEMERLKKNAAFSQAAAEERAKEIEELKARLEVVEKNLAEAGENRDKTELALGEAQARLEEQTMLADVLKQERAEAETRADEVENELKAARNKILDLKEDLIEAAKNRAVIEQDGARERMEAEEEINRLRANHAGLASELKRVEKEAEEKEKRIRELESALTDSRKVVEKIQGELAEARIRVAELEGENKARANREEGYAKTLETMGKVIEAMRLESLKVEKGQKEKEEQGKNKKGGN